MSRSGAQALQSDAHSSPLVRSSRVAVDLQHFLNPALFLAGAGARFAADHYSSDQSLRYKRVRFAAMEFLLARSKKPPQSLDRTAAPAAGPYPARPVILAHDRRLIVDPKHLSLFQGARTHHVVLLDDTGSMRDRVGEQSAFDTARDVLQGIISQGAQRPGTQRITVVTMSNPSETTSGLTERDVDSQLVDDAAVQLRDLSCSFGSGIRQKRSQPSSNALSDRAEREGAAYRLGLSPHRLVRQTAHWSANWRPSMTRTSV